MILFVNWAQLCSNIIDVGSIEESLCWNWPGMPRTPVCATFLIIVTLQGPNVSVCTVTNSLFTRTSASSLPGHWQVNNKHKSNTHAHLCELEHTRHQCKHRATHVSSVAQMAPVWLELKAARSQIWGQAVWRFDADASSQMVDGLLGWHCWLCRGAIKLQQLWFWKLWFSHNTRSPVHKYVQRSDSHSRIFAQIFASASLCVLVARAGTAAKEDLQLCVCAQVCGLCSTV